MTISRKIFACGLFALGISAPASAADLRPAYKAAPPVAVVAPYNWTGFYIGGHLGYAWTDHDWSSAFAFGGWNHGANGFIAGGQIGVNWQASGSPWVFGIEGDYSWANIDSDTSVFGIRTRADVNSFATLTGRIGYAWDTSLFYVKGGAAWMDTDYSVPGIAAWGGGSRSGWTLGVGFEQAIAASNWSWKIEYNYMDFGSERITLTGIPGVGLADVDSNAHVLKVGLNYRFGWGKGPVAGPVVARY